MIALRSYGLAFGVALAASLALTLLVRTAARRFGLVAKPRADRWHRKPTALYGGVGIFLGFIVSFVVRRPARFEGIWLLMACASGMFVLGLVDDRVQLKPYAKLVGQIVLATAFTLFGLRLHWLPNAIIDQGLSILWLVGLTNALNLLDNIDGAAAGVAAIAAAFMVYLFHVSGKPGAATMAAALDGALLGFLVFNFNPASIFMGDCGSLFLGFLLGGLTLATTDVGARRNVLAMLAVPVLLMLIPILDTTLVTIARRYHGRRVSQGGKDHTSHRLVALGLSERAATLTLWAMAAVSGGVAVFVQNQSTFIALAVVGAFVMTVLFAMIFLGKVKVYEAVASEDEAKGRTLLPTLADFTYKRRIAEVLNDLVLILLAYYGAFLLRFEGALSDELYIPFLRSLPVVLLGQISSFLALGLYRGVWRYTGLDDLRVILKAVGVAVLVSSLAALFLFRSQPISRAVLLIDGLLLLLGVAGTRISFRLIRNWLVAHRPGEGKPVIVYGAGDGGETLVRELQNNPRLGLRAVAFLDDDPQKHGRLIHGVKVMGSGDDLARVAAAEQAGELVISTSLPAEREEKVTQACAGLGVACRKMRFILE